MEDFLCTRIKEFDFYPVVLWLRNVRCALESPGNTPDPLKQKASAGRWARSKKKGELTRINREPQEIFKQ